MQSNAKTVDEYIANLPEDRRHIISVIRDVILKNLPVGYEERMIYGMIGYVVPHSLYPAGYHCDPNLPLSYAGLASQKNHFALYLMCVYGHTPTQEWFKKAWMETGKRLDMGKSCVRFRRLDDVPLEVVGKVISRVSVADYIEAVESVLAQAELRKKKGGSKPVKKTGNKKSRQT